MGEIPVDQDPQAASQDEGAQGDGTLGDAAPTGAERQAALEQLIAESGATDTDLADIVAWYESSAKRSDP